MFGWIKRRLLARKCRKALQSVESYSAARARMAAVRQSDPPTAPDYSALQPAPGGFLIVGDDVDAVRLQAELQRHTGLPVLRSAGLA
ncbi:TPA: hypothetical protein NHP34_006069 [Pseudomonas aeruginosa]|nr:hypothetical protein [Pseudomonas aeruginosa]